MNDRSKVVLLLAIQLRQWVEFAEKHLEDFDLEADEQVMVRSMRNTYYTSMRRFGYEFTKEVDQALFDMIGGYMKE